MAHMDWIHSTNEIRSPNLAIKLHIFLDMTAPEPEPKCFHLSNLGKWFQSQHFFCVMRSILLTIK